MIMPTSNITITSVKNALGETTSSVGNLCTSPKVNMWSKYKPVRYDSEVVDFNSNWWHSKYKDQNCGISIPTSHVPLDAAQAIWTYLKPRGNSVPTGVTPEPFRLGDFRSYDHNAKPFLYMLNTKDSAIDLKLQTKLVFEIYDSIKWKQTTNTSLDRDDWNGYVPQIGDLYGCALLVKGNTSYLVTTTGPIKGGIETSDITLDFSLIPASVARGEWTVYFLLSSAQFNMVEVTNDTQAYDFYPIYTLPDQKNPIKVTISESIRFPVFLTATAIRGTELNVNSTYRDINLYTISGGKTQVLKTLGGITLRCTLENKNNTLSTLYNNSVDNKAIRIDIQDINGITKIIEGGIWYDSNFNFIETIEIPPNSSKTMYIVIPDAILPISGMAPTQQKGYQWNSMMEILIKTDISGYQSTYYNILRLEYNNPDF